MVFSSLIFLFAYLPITLIIYFAVPRRVRNLVLFAVSLVFYGWDEPKYIAVMLFEICTAYFCGFYIQKYRQSAVKKAKGWLCASLFACLAVLLFFKYSGFVLDNLRALIPSVPSVTMPKMPVGISFYTFQIMSYSVDVYRGETDAQKNFVAFGAYVTLFPQLIAGPIVRYRDVDDMLTERHESIAKAASGAERFCVGLAKKVLLADGCAAMVASFGAANAVTGDALTAWMRVLAFTLEIYFDFSGYSDMAIGLGRIFGFEFIENFDYPYLSKSVSEFWRRWHISLSTWFKEYVYIPLGGSHRGMPKKYRNLAIVWLLTGIWHGASWNFILWGVYFGALIIIEKAFLGRLIAKLPKALCVCYTMLAVVFGWALFDGGTLQGCIDIIGSMFRFISPTASAIYDTLRYLPLLAVCVVGCTPLPKKIFAKARAKAPVLAPILCVIALVLCTAYMVDSTYSPFLYFNF